MYATCNLLDRELLGRLFEPLVHVESRNGLFRSSNEVLVVTITSDLQHNNRLILASAYMRFKLKSRLIHYFVKFFIEFRKLGSLGHDILLHEERSLKLLESSLAKEGETIVDQSKVKIDTSIGQEVTTVTSDVGTTLLIITVQACQDFVMRKNVGLLDWLNTFVVVSANDFVIVLKVQMCFRSKPI